MNSPSVVTLTQELIRLDTVNPPGNEGAAMAHLAALLGPAGFSLETVDIQPGRGCLIARLGGAGDKPLCFSGHLDTVPLGEQPWRVDPFGGEIRDGRVWGRGAADMKGGVAAIAVAALRAAAAPDRQALMLAFTCGEETGCDGARALAASGRLGDAAALVVAEPTSNRPCIGHKGALWLTLTFRGRTAHGSMPQLGDNAVVKAATAITRLSEFVLPGEPHPQLGKATLNIGRMRGGTNVNSVPDLAEIALDLRTLPAQNHDAIVAAIARETGGKADIVRLVDLGGIWTAPDHPWVTQVASIAARVRGVDEKPDTAPYFTDASVLTPALGAVPTVILGPGDMAMAHQTDEYCAIQALHEAVEIYAAAMT
jgi:succinyl-diaminopimelate desuccinylase